MRMIPIQFSRYALEECHPLIQSYTISTVAPADLWMWFREQPFVVLVRIVGRDFFSLALVWTALWAFGFLPKYMPIPGFAGKCIEFFHQLGGVIVAALMVWFLVVDVYKWHGDQD